MKLIYKNIDEKMKYRDGSKKKRKIENESEQEIHRQERVYVLKIKIER